MSNKRMDLAVLMSVYIKSDAKQLAESLDSLWNQTVQAGRVVLMGDGPLTDEVKAEIARQQAAHPELEFYPQKVNRGLGLVLQTGLGLITEKWTARLDSDDIATPTRFEKQLSAAKQENADVIGTALQEFITGADGGYEFVAIRRLPETHLAIAKYAKINSPINHPSVLYRTQLVKDVGGYQDLRYLEDYDLFARLLAAGARFVNLSEPLTLFRTDGMLTRRAAKGMFNSERKLQANLVRYGLVSRPRALFNLVARTTFRLLPTSLMALAYRKLFHKRS